MRLMGRLQGVYVADADHIPDGCESDTSYHAGAIYRSYYYRGRVTALGFLMRELKRTRSIMHKRNFPPLTHLCPLVDL